MITLSVTPFYIQLETDFLKYEQTAENKDEIKKRLLELYFNNDEFYFENYFKKREKTRSIKYGNVEDWQKTIEKSQSIQTQKLYLLIERKIKYAKEVDELLNIDNSFDKYLEHKLCFLHDVF